ncbi:MAG: FAD-binding oxidoreductase [Pseudomonadales bacterium]
MRRWNGWGMENSEYTTTLGDAALQVLGSLIGTADPLPESTLAQVVDKVPPSRLPEHHQVNTGAEVRVRHARGQSLPDVLEMRGCEVDTFPDGVALPESSDDVRDLLDYAQQHDIVVIPYGGGTSVVGHINPEAGDKPVLTISMERMNRLIDLDRDSQLATFGAGTPGPQLEEQLQREGYTLGHFPQSWELSTVGGWVASRSSGQQSLRYGRIEQMFAGGRVETQLGTLDIPTIPASSAGPDLREIIMGSEGRMGIITEVKVRVTPLPESESFHVYFFSSWSNGAVAAKDLAQNKVQLSMVRLSNEMETMTLLLSGDPDEVAELDSRLQAAGIGDGRVMMTVGVTGSARQCECAGEIAQEICAGQGGIDGGGKFGEKWAHGRFSAPYLRDPLLAAGFVVDTMETAVDWGRVDHTLATVENAIRTTAEAEGEQVHVYTHLSHVYSQGSSIYTTYIFRCADSYQSTLQRWKRFKTAGANAIVSCGGTISHQHGVGADHRDFIAAEKGPLGLAAIRKLCDLFDPDGRFNPGKLLPEDAD